MIPSATFMTACVRMYPKIAYTCVMVLDGIGIGMDIVDVSVVCGLCLWIHFVEFILRRLALDSLPLYASASASVFNWFIMAKREVGR